MDAKSDNDVNDWVKQSVPGRAPFLDGSLGTTVKGGGYFKTAVGILGTAASIIDANLLGTVLASQYGLSGRIKILSSEVECTAEVNLSDSRRLILKASRQSEAFDSFQFQSAVIKAVEGAKGFVTPRILPTAGSAQMFQHDGLSGYLQTRVHGVPLNLVSRTPALLLDIGKALAHLDLALSRHTLPAMDRPVLWHIGCWPQLMDLQRYLTPGPVADAVHRAMSDFVEVIEPRLGDLAWQITHNDPSLYNTLLTDNGIAFIDFGDGCWEPKIQDLAIAASHVVSDPSLPLGGAEHLIAGYASVLALSPLEADLLVGLMKARQSALILINCWRSHLFPENAPYIKKNVGRAEHGLSILAQWSAAEGRRAVRKAASMS